MSRPWPSHCPRSFLQQVLVCAFKLFAKLQRPHLPAHSPLLLRHSSLPFARLQTLKTLKTLKTLQIPRGSFHQALWPSAFEAGRQLLPVPHSPPTLPAHSSAVCQAFKPQLPPSPLAVKPCCSRVAACPLPAHPSRQLPPSSWPSAFQHCSLPFACT